jgi:hypothetical protein
VSGRLYKDQVSLAGFGPVEVRPRAADPNPNRNPTPDPTPTPTPDPTPKPNLNPNQARLGAIEKQDANFGQFEQIDGVVGFTSGGNEDVFSQLVQARLVGGRLRLGCGSSPRPSPSLSTPSPSPTPNPGLHPKP